MEGWVRGRARGELNERNTERDNRYIREYSPAALDEICQTTGGSQFVLVRVLKDCAERAV